MRLLVDVRERDRHERRIDLGPELGFVAGEVVELQVHGRAENLVSVAVGQA